MQTRRSAKTGLPVRTTRLGAAIQEHVAPDRTHVIVPTKVSRRFRLHVPGHHSTFVESNGAMRFVLTSFSASILAMTAWHLATVIRDELQVLHESDKLRALMPHYGSLGGIDSFGRTIALNVDTQGYLDGKGKLLVFVLHRHSIVGEIKFWNRVITQINILSASIAAPVRYWGICDEGSACNPYQSVAQFSILGYLNPYQMHGRFMELSARVAINGDASAESSVIFQQIRQGSSE